MNRFPIFSWQRLRKNLRLNILNLSSKNHTLFPNYRFGQPGELLVINLILNKIDDDIS